MRQSVPCPQGVNVFLYSRDSSGPSFWRHGRWKELGHAYLELGGVANEALASSRASSGQPAASGEVGLVWSNSSCQVQLKVSGPLAAAWLCCAAGVHLLPCKAARCPASQAKAVTVPEAVS